MSSNLISYFSIIFLSALVFLAVLIKGLKLQLRTPLPELNMNAVRKIAFNRVLKIRSIVCISGVDGAGKTTQSILLKRFLDNLGMRTIILHLRCPKYTSYIVAGIGKTLRLNRYLKMPNGAIKVYHFYDKDGLRILWPLTTMIDTYLISIKLFVLRRRFNVLIVDRFVFDSVADLSFEVKNEGLVSSMVGRAFLALQNKFVGFQYILDASPDVILNRKDEMLPGEFEVKRLVYRNLCKIVNSAVLVDVSKDRDAVHGEISSHLMRRMRQKDTYTINR